MPGTSGDRRIRAETSGKQGESRGIRDQERPMPLIAVPEGLPQLAHGLEVIAIEQRPHALPHQAFAPQFAPDRSE
jgi:hypothetical protein